MKLTVYLLTAALILWIAGASYCYVCEIRGNCLKSDQPGTAYRLKVANSQGETKYKSDTAGIPEASPVIDTLTIIEDYLNKAGKRIIYFGFAQSEAVLDAGTIEFIENSCYFLNHHPEARIHITGHSDSRGTKEGNLRFSRLRVEYLEKILASTGIKSDQVVLKAKGDTEPIASNQTEEGRTLNRRAEITIQK